MANTYEPIASQTLPSEAASITFSSIPEVFTDLVLEVSAGTTVGANLTIRVNEDSGNNYSYIGIFGDGSVSGSARANNIGFAYLASRTSIMSPAHVSFMSYSNTNVFKIILSSDAGSHVGGYVQEVTNLWRSTSAINSITILSNSGLILSSSMFSLYGIKAA